MDLNGNKSPDFFEHAMVIVGTYLLLLHYFNSAAFTEYNTIHCCHSKHCKAISPQLLILFLP